jgi:hypothetical protein
LSVPDSVKGAAAPVLGALGAAAGALGGVAAGKATGGAGTQAGAPAAPTAGLPESLQKATAGMPQSVKDAAASVMGELGLSGGAAAPAGKWGPFPLCCLTLVWAGL